MKYINGLGQRMSIYDITGYQTNKLNLRFASLWYNCPQDRHGYIDCKQCYYDCNAVRAKAAEVWNCGQSNNNYCYCGRHE